MVLSPLPFFFVFFFVIFGTGAPGVKVWHRVTFPRPRLHLDPDQSPSKHGKTGLTRSNVAARPPRKGKDNPLQRKCAFFLFFFWFFFKHTHRLGSENALFFVDGDSGSPAAAFHI